MSEDPKAEQAAWADLLQSPGWDRLVAHAKAEWNGPSFVGQVETLADNAQDLVALSKLRQLLAAKRAVMRLLAVPEEQVAKAKLHAQDVEDGTTMSRRGRL